MSHCDFELWSLPHISWTVIAKRVFRDPRHAWQTNKKQSTKTKQNKINKQTENKTKTKIKWKKKWKKKSKKKKRKIGIRYSRNYPVKLFHDEFSIVILICSMYLILGILALYILVFLCSIICGERWFFVFHHIGRIA